MAHTHPDFLSKRQIIDRLTDPETGRQAISLRTLERYLAAGHIKRAGAARKKVLVAWKEYLSFKDKLERGEI